jgi:ketosteroid isomerase-like protein
MTVEERLSALEAEVRQLRDQAEIYRIICSWGAAADIGSGEQAAALWTDDAVLAFESGEVRGRAGVAQMIDSAEQWALVEKGCAHVQGFPVVVIDGDTARAVNYSQVFVHGDDGYSTWRVTANNWELRRTPEGWRAVRRTAQVIDGSPSARALLAHALDR